LQFCTPYPLLYLFLIPFNIKLIPALGPEQFIDESVVWVDGAEPVRVVVGDLVPQVARDEVVRDLVGVEPINLNMKK
jgi:hypothetical protein